MSTKMYPKKSAVNPTVLDNHSRSALHYLVRPLPEGSYDNYRLLQQLVSVGAPLEQSDKDGKTVLDYALANGLPRLTTAAQYLTNNGKAALVSDVPIHAHHYLFLNTYDEISKMIRDHSVHLG